MVHAKILLFGLQMTFFWDYAKNILAKSIKIVIVWNKVIQDKINPSWSNFFTEIVMESAYDPNAKTIILHFLKH